MPPTYIGTDGRNGERCAEIERDPRRRGAWRLYWVRRAYASEYYRSLWGAKATVARFVPSVKWTKEHEDGHTNSP